MMYGLDASSSNLERNAKQALARGAILLDVRTRDEFDSEHVSGAVNIPVQELGARMHELGARGTAVVVYCRSGARSAAAAQLLRSAGREVIDLGPMPRW